MVNHFRTLLLNATPAGPDASPGEEYVPPEFVPLRPSGVAETVRRVLFGTTPDRLMLNFRAAQFMPILHASELVGLVTDLDPRITYDPLGRPVWFDWMTFAPAVYGSDLDVFGAPLSPDALGTTSWQFEVVLADGQLTATRQLPTPVVAVGTDSVELPGSGYSARPTSADDKTWAVDIALRPTRTPADLVLSLMSAGSTLVDELFGPAEPYATLVEIWRDARATPDKLAAVLVALVYRAEERRRAGAG